MNNVLNIIEKTKTCKKCGESKVLSEFTRTPNTKDGYLGKCKVCNKPDAKLKAYYSDYGKKWRKELMQDPEKHAALKEKKNAWNRTEKYYNMYYGKRFGVSYVALVSMLASQNGMCANIGCSKSIVLPPSEGDRACVDHSHVTGKVRALLCVRCNTTLGHIENDKNLIPGLLDYLNKHKD